MLGELNATRDEFLGYYVMDPAESRSARLFTSEIIATRVSERRRMAGKTDPLFAATSNKTTIRGVKLSALGIGSLPPLAVAEAPIRFNVRLYCGGMPSSPSRG